MEKNDLIWHHGNIAKITHLYKYEPRIRIKLNKNGSIVNIYKYSDAIVPLIKCPEYLKS